ncbi:TetR/AcrR family transcriptional regulator [Pseudosporangium ferrugineum]|uniref:TetR family transcriptional regulator n=1 Tax=Pseudosporangium ferrugineum TaxID=439699 RepID=A0A2T0RLH6_9ACTN|nr:TetR/AcrR family transcriptional regulator [Pseudosporangium ferrugineum]PRY21987.1 TetR family transcriptional regulator [Pseudosporangium ferrugineum]
MRIDAEENRARIIAAARDLIAEAGPDVPMARVARRAGVGKATLYRRFPTRKDLVAQTYADRHAQCSASWHEAARDPDPARAFRETILRLCAAQVVDRGYTTAVLSGQGLDIDRADYDRALSLLLDRARAAGALRPGIGAADLWLLLAGNAGVIAVAGPGAPAASRRFAEHMLRSFAPDPAGHPRPASSG